MQIVHSEFQDQLVRGLTHRMNNILTLFHGYVGLMLDNKKLDKPTLDGLAKIKDGARAAAELMDRTHALVRPSTAVWREIDLGLMLPMLRQNFEAWRGPKTKLELEIPEELPKIWGDASRIKTAILELTRNALEATSAGGTVKVALHGDAPAATTSSAAQPLKWVSLTVTDSGPGIAPELREKIFAPFFSTKHRKNAAGLGLTVALGFVQQQGGVIRFESEPGKTWFQILLPSHAE